MSGYTKLFESILESTVWQTPQATRLVWITMLAMADKDGVVEGSIPGLAKRAGVSLPEAEDALTCLMSPDHYSRTKDHEGRRIEEIDGGWRLLNHRKYRDKLSEIEQREKSAARSSRYRQRHAKTVTRHAASRDVTPSHEKSRASLHSDSDTSPDSEAEERENAREDAPPIEPAAEIRAEPVSGVVAMPANDSRRAVSSAHVQEWADVLAETFERATPSRAAPKATRDQTWQLAEHCRDLARVHGVSFRDAAQKLAQSALAAASRPADKPGERYPFSVLALDPYAATQAAPGAVGESFEAYQARRRADPWAGIKQ